MRARVLTRLVVVCALVVFVPACNSCRGSTVSSPTVDAAVSSASSSRTTSTASVSTDAKLAPDIGLAALPSVPSKDAVDANTEGFKAHEKRDFAKSRALFEKALSLSPDFALARFNRACALARLGELAASAADLRVLLESDLRRFAPKYRADEDLAPLRASNEGRTLDAHVALLESMWTRAHDRGVVAFLWRRASMTRPLPGSGDEWVAPSTLRPGVYLHDVRRFVAMTREIEGAKSAIVDDARTSASFLTSYASSVGCGVICPPERDRRLLIASFDGHDDTNANWVDAPTMFGWSGLALVLDPTTFGAFAREDVPTGGMPWYRITAAGSSAEAADAGAPPRARYEYSYRGTRRIELRVPAGYSVAWHGHGLELTTPSGAHAYLPKEHSFPSLPADATGARPEDMRAILPSPDGRLVVVVSNVDQCTCWRSEDAPGPYEVLAHAVSLLEPSSGRAWLLDAGPGRGEAVFDADGAMFVQGEETVKRWTLPAGAATPIAESITPGVLLVTPLAPRASCCSA